MEYAFELIKTVWPLYIAIILVIAFKLLSVQIQLSKSHYKDITGNGLFKTLFNRGNYGELLIFIRLEKMGETKILSNIYLPLDNGTTTEVDLLLVNRYGIFVFESKNYSGWIFGNEKNKMWTQSLKGGKKNKFFNPIWQNKGHISALDKTLNKRYTTNFYSYIVFSERCELKKINIISSNVKVLKRNQLISVLKKHKETENEVLSEQQVNEIYDMLKQYILASNEIKEKHISDIKAKR